MIISPENGPLAYNCLRCWDRHHMPVKDIVWFNPDSMVCTARINKVEQRVEVSRFIFLAVLETTAERLRASLPDYLHNKIEDQ